MSEKENRDAESIESKDKSIASDENKTSEIIEPSEETISQKITTDPDYEPPLNVFLVLHIDPIMPEGNETFKATPKMCDLTSEEIDWLREEATRHNLNFTSLYNGWYPQMALEMDYISQFETLVSEGHEIGSHAHNLTYDPDKDYQYILICKIVPQSG